MENHGIDKCILCDATPCLCIKRAQEARSHRPSGPRVTMPSRSEVLSVYSKFRRNVSTNPSTRDEMRDYLLAELIRKTFMFE
jgi:hypothetical protein